MKDRNAMVRCAALATILLSMTALPSVGEEIWSARNGTATLMLYHDLLDEAGVTAADAIEGASSSAPFSKLTLQVPSDSALTFTVLNGSVVDVFGRSVQLIDGLELLSGDTPRQVDQLALASAGAFACDGGCLELRDLKAGFDPRAAQLTLFSRRVTISPMLASMLGHPELAGAALGTAQIRVAAEWIDGDQPAPLDALLPMDGDTEAGVIGPDVTLCQVYDLRQFGRLGSVVGLSSAGTSWNLGDERLDWFPVPNPKHPYIVYNVFRIKNDRFEQIGQSWIKHGFCALDNSQCTTQCAFPTGCSTLNVGCTDTYSSPLNAGQSGLGPRHELNPWTGDWSYTGSHFQVGGGPHTAISHRLQVNDADLDPAQNAGATYFTDQVYYCYDDVNMINSSGWKPVTPNGSPGGTWFFSMSGGGTMPNIGLTIDAWTGARQTVLAQEVPVVEFVSPDGRCILAMKSTDLGDGTWHYEYALLNLDMDRKVKTFSIPIPAGVTVTNEGFHAVRHHDEGNAGYSNDPWSVSVGGGSCEWTTVDNPVRWGTVYNFRFDADRPPGDVTVSLGMYDPGSPMTVTGVTSGPVVPQIIYGLQDTSFGDAAFTGYIDPRSESSDGVNFDRGLAQVTVRFSEPMRNIGGADLSADAFFVTETGALAPPTVTGISTADNQTVVVTLSRIITLREWTTVRVEAENMDGDVIANMGDLGPGMQELDRVDVGFLPADITQSGNVNPLDLLRFKQYVNEVSGPDRGLVVDYLDANRSGGVNPLDLLAFKQLINGVSPPATQSWAMEAMNNVQP